MPLGVDIVGQRVKPLTGSHIPYGSSGFNPGYSLLGSLLKLPGRRKMMTQVFGCLAPIWEIQLEFLIPSFSLTQPWLMREFGDRWIDEWVDDVYIDRYKDVSSLCH